jgi:hypothetical protein
MRTLPVVLTLLAGVTASSSASAWHHDLAQLYERGRTITLTGRVTAVQWMNPHVVVTLAAEDQSLQTWRIELDPPGALGRREISRDQIPEGSSITVIAHPAKNGGPTAVARTVTLPSGRELVVTTDTSWNWREMPLKK